MIDPDYGYDWIGFEMMIYQLGNLDWSRLNSWWISIEVMIDLDLSINLSGIKSWLIGFQVMINRKWGHDLI